MAAPSTIPAQWNKILKDLRRNEEKARLGGGEANIAKQHQKGRLTARERIAQLIDPDSSFFELGLFAAHEMYDEWGGAPSAGVITGIGRIDGRLFMIVANDATVKAGAFFPMTIKKVLRAQRIAMDNRLPLIYLVDSSGVFLPLQDEIFPDEDDFGRIFRHNARMSSRGIPQIAAIMGSCVAGGAYLPVMCDKILMTEGSGLYIAGPALVKAAIGQAVSSEQLGGAHLHAALSGTVDFREPDDPSCLARVRWLVEMMAPAPAPAFQRQPSRPPRRAGEEIYSLFPLNASQEYDMRGVIECFVDDSQYVEYKDEYGKTLTCGYARIDGWAVGIVANQKLHVKDPGRPIEVGGVIYTESADKAARFMMDCNQNRVPLVFLHDVNGFMVGRDAEVSGIIKSGAKMVNVVSNSIVPKFTVILGGSYGAGHYAMCGRAYDPRFILAWPTARYAVMGGDQAAKTLLDIRLAQLEKEGKSLGDEEKEEQLRSIRDKYTRELDPRYAAARLWVDGLIEPHQTRSALALALEVAALNPELEPFSTGVLQV